jgi:hypothetical protein
MRNILNTYLDARNGEGSTFNQRTERMPRQGGRTICESLMSLNLEIEEATNLTRAQKEDLQAAVKKLWLARECDKMSIDEIY